MVKGRLRTELEEDFRFWLEVARNAAEVREKLGADPNEIAELFKRDLDRYEDVFVYIALPPALVEEPGCGGGLRVWGRSMELPPGETTCFDGPDAWRERTERRLLLYPSVARMVEPGHWRTGHSTKVYWVLVLEPFWLYRYAEKAGYTVTIEYDEYDFYKMTKAWLHRRR